MQLGRIRRQSFELAQSPAERIRRRHCYRACCDWHLHVAPLLVNGCINKAINKFRQIDPVYLVTAHCAGDRFNDRGRRALGDKVIRSAAAGMRFVFGSN
jgi:hypothetical protein